MSLKPSKFRDRKISEEKMGMKKRIFEEKNKLPPPTLIISEGTKTEVHYIKGLAKLINEKYSEAYRRGSRFLDDDRIKVYGTGRNTLSLLKWVRNFVEKPENKHYKRIWIMYDQDDFPLYNFDNTQYSINDKECDDADRKFFAAWSNECIELWFILHFQELTANVGREQYKKILNGYFDYDKAAADTYDILDKHDESSIDLAISRAKKLYESYGEKTSPSKMVPATRVYELVEELRGYLQE